MFLATHHAQQSDHSTKGIDAPPGLLPIAAVLLGVCLLVGITVIVVNRPRVALDRDGITVTRLLRSSHLAWADLVVRSAQLGPHGGSLYMRTMPDRTGRSSNVATLPTAWLHVDPVLLETAVRTYIDQPDRRVEIGTDVGLQRLTIQANGATAHRSTWPADWRSST
jgi:hypothetical protein